MSPENLILLAPWVVLVAYCGIVWMCSPRAVSATQFFRGGAEAGGAPAFIMLVFSAAITWVFAKSIANAANLGQTFGVMGGVGYATYYFSFLIAAIAIYFIRTRGGFGSLASFLIGKYGAVCARLFLIAIGIRLFNEVWSNTKVSALYFGDEGSTAYWIAALCVTAFTMFYAWRGGLRSSLLTDAGQMLLAAVLLVAVLVAVFPADRTRAAGRAVAGTYGRCDLHGAVGDPGAELPVPRPRTDRPGVPDRTENHGEGVYLRRSPERRFHPAVQLGRALRPFRGSVRRIDDCGADGVRAADAAGVQRDHADQRGLDARFDLRQHRQACRHRLARPARRAGRPRPALRPQGDDRYRAIRQSAAAVSLCR